MKNKKAFKKKHDKTVFNHLRITFKWLIFFSLNLSLFESYASQMHAKVKHAEPPGWIDSVSYDSEIKVPGDQISSGIYYYLVEQQSHSEEQIDFYRYDLKILNNTGVQNYSEINLEFDPTYQTLFIHKIEIIRNGQSLDKFEPDKFKIIQREQDLDRYIYDGTLSAVLFLDDVRVGDIISYSYSIQGYNPISEGKFYDVFSLQWNKPVGKIFYRLLTSFDRAIYIKNLNSDIKPQILSQNNYKEYIWQATHIGTLHKDSNTPSWYSPYPKVIISEYENWSGVVEWALRLYEYPQHVSEPLKQLIDSFKNESECVEEVMVKALKFVQNDIRYLGIEFGANSHKPSNPSEVLERRFGDCKDKTFLLCFILNQAGINACPAFVNTYKQDIISDYLPSPFAFNHAVVYAELNSQGYWFDPTFSFQGGTIKKIYFPNYKKGLIIKSDTLNLSEIKNNENVSSKIQIKETFDVTDYHKPGILHLEERYTGVEADALRDRLTLTSREKFIKSYINYYSFTYADLNVLPGTFQVRDNESDNHITVRADFEIPEIWTLSDNNRVMAFKYFCSIIDENLHRPANSMRTMPYSLSYPLNLVVDIEINTPKDFLLDNKEETIEDDNIIFYFQKKYKTKKILLKYEYKNKRDFIPAVETKDYIKKVDKIFDMLTYSIETTNFGLQNNNSGKDTQPEKSQLFSWTLYTYAALFIITFFQFVIPYYGQNKYSLSDNAILLAYLVSFILSVSILFYDYYHAPNFTIIFMVFIGLMIDQLRHITKL